MTVLLVVLGLATGSLLSVLMGLVGSRRRIGFGWTFVLGVLFTPLVGLIAALLSAPLPEGERRWGCLASLLGLLAVVLLVLLVLALTGVLAAGLLV